MATGKILQFDPGRGYGFVAADDGGEDIFLHASVFDGDPSDLTPGAPLEFQVMAGDRGRKAFAVRFAEDKPAPREHSVLSPQALIPSQARPTTDARPATDEEQMCDVLSQAEFGAELTELLLNTIPALTGPQILELRKGMLEFARKRGWVDA
jgi:CspA family cold shock protein